MTKGTTKHTGYDFENEDVVLDFASFDTCGFKNCNIIYYGHGKFDLQGCNFEGCRWILEGPAQAVIAYLSAMYNGGNQGGRELVEATFQNIRTGNQGSLM
jgi:hypothetical protein